MNDHSTRNQIDRTRDHLANERTFLAWLRTSLAALGFGFVLARMGLFLRELPSLVRQPGGPLRHVEVGGEFVLTGAVFLAVGTILALWAAWHYERNRRHLERDTFTPAIRSPRIIAALVFLAGILIIAMVLARGLLPHPVALPHAPGAP
jgi:putative membrane protein